MSTFTKIKNSVLAAFALLVAAAAILVGAGFVGGSSSKASRPAPIPKPPLMGPWHYMADAPQPIAAGRVVVWTGTEMILAGTNPGSDGTYIHSTELAESYNPVSDTWRTLATPPETPSYCRRDAVWTGTEMLVWGCKLLAFDPAKNEWRRLPDPPTRHGIAVWTGRELIGWGGGCCGDASDDGSAYDPVTSTWRKIAPAPIGGQQSPDGAWTGRELVILSGQDPEGKPVGGAAYNPTTDTWRRIADLPGRYVAGQAFYRDGNVYAVGVRPSGTSLLQLDLERDTWKDLGWLAESPGSAVLAGNRLVMLGGERARSAGVLYFFSPGATVPVLVPSLAQGDDPVVVWTGRRVLVWGGTIPTPANTSNPPRYLSSGLVFRPRKVSPPLPQCCGG
jgi:hypothetical protein